MSCVFLLTTGDDVEEGKWELVSIHGSEAGAAQAKARYESAPQTGTDGTVYFRSANLVEVWKLEG